MDQPYFVNFNLTYRCIKLSISVVLDGPPCNSVQRDSLLKHDISFRSLFLILTAYYFNSKYFRNHAGGG